VLPSSQFLIDAQLPMQKLRGAHYLMSAKAARPNPNLGIAPPLFSQLLIVRE